MRLSASIARHAALPPSLCCPAASSAVLCRPAVGRSIGSVARVAWAAASQTTLSAAKPTLRTACSRLVGGAQPLALGQRLPSLCTVHGSTLRHFASGSQHSLYEVLGVPPSATQQEIKKAYLQEAKKSHPDLNKSPDATKRFQALAAAYTTLGSPESRARYDAGPSPFESGSSYAGSGARRSYSQQPPPPGQSPQEPVDAFKLFRAVLEELGADQLVEYMKGVQSEASEAARKAKEDGDMGAAKEFVWKHKGLATMVVLPVFAVLRFPGLVAAALRMIGVFGLMVVQAICRDPKLQQLVGRYAWYSWQLLRSRSAARAREKDQKKDQTKP